MPWIMAASEMEALHAVLAVLVNVPKKARLGPAVVAAAAAAVVAANTTAASSGAMAASAAVTAELA
jgi:hypothetical protein